MSENNYSAPAGSVSSDFLSSFPSLLPSPSGKSATWMYTTLTIVASLLVLEQAVYRYKKGPLPGAKWTIPIIGKFTESLSPLMENYQAQWDSGALSAISVFNIFIVMASTTDYARKILNSPNHAEPCLVYSAKKVLFPDNWVFLTGKEHVEFRRGLNLLFTRKAMGMYVGIQEAVTRQHFAEWAKRYEEKPYAQSIMMEARALNMDTSLRVFCGDYIPAHATKEIGDKYWLITQALELVNFPLALPGTKIYNACIARDVAVKWLQLAAHKSKENMATGAEPSCLLDEWVKTITAPEYKFRSNFSDREMALVVFSFLFASQDAMSSGLVYGFQHLVDHPAILEKVREEQMRVRQGDVESPLTFELLDQMPYLQAVVKESMRVRPPVTMVPYKTTKAFPINDEFVVPSGSMVIPSFYNSLHDSEVYPNPDTFDPERWLSPDSLANKNPKNYLVWGAGPHKCIGIEYASMNIALVLATAAVMFDWEHEVTELSSRVDILPTLFPGDGCRLKLTPRVHA